MSDRLTVEEVDEIAHPKHGIYPPGIFYDHAHQVLAKQLAATMRENEQLRGYLEQIYAGTDEDHMFKLAKEALSNKDLDHFRDATKLVEISTQDSVE